MVCPYKNELGGKSFLLENFLPAEYSDEYPAGWHLVNFPRPRLGLPSVKALKRLTSTKADQTHPNFQLTWHRN